MGGRYRDKSFRERFAVMGDTAEGVYVEVAPLGKTDRFGFRRPKVSLKHMAQELRHMPDFYAESGHLVEVMGLGRDGILKLKLDKYEALKVWNKLQEVVLFVWNSHERQWAMLSWDTLKSLVRKARNEGTDSFKDGNEYYPIYWEWIEEAAPYVSYYDRGGWVS